MSIKTGFYVCLVVINARPVMRILINAMNVRILRIGCRSLIVNVGMGIMTRKGLLSVRGVLILVRLVLLIRNVDIILLNKNIYYIIS